MEKDNNLDERQKKMLDRAIKTYKSMMDAKDPARAFDLMMKALRGRIPGDPANPSIDEVTDYILENANTLLKSEEDSFKDFLLIFSQKIKENISEKLNNPNFEDIDHLVIHVERKWAINAQVRNTPPYHIHFSTNLFRFCVGISELLISNMNLNIENDDPSIESVQVPPRYSEDEVVQHIREMLVSFIKDKQIHLKRIFLPASHQFLHNAVLITNMAFILCHEFGHAIISDCKNKGTPPPFSDAVKDLVRSSFNKIIDKHDKENCFGLKNLSRLELEKVISNWVNEINADIISASLTKEYQIKNGPSRDVPGILGITYMAIHLSFRAQILLFGYLYYFENIPFLSRTHPPLDFRMHCVLLWMYGSNYDSTDAFKVMSAWGQQILERVIGESSKSQ